MYAKGQCQEPANHGYNLVQIGDVDAAVRHDPGRIGPAHRIKPAVLDPYGSKGRDRSRTRSHPATYPSWLQYPSPGTVPRLERLARAVLPENHRTAYHLNKVCPCGKCEPDDQNHEQRNRVEQKRADEQALLKRDPHAYQEKLCRKAHPADHDHHRDPLPLPVPASQEVEQRCPADEVFAHGQGRLDGCDYAHIVPLRFREELKRASSAADLLVYLMEEVPDSDDRHGERGHEIISDGISRCTSGVQCPANDHREEDEKPAGQVSGSVQGGDECKALVTRHDGRPAACHRHGYAVWRCVLRCVKVIFFKTKT